jgi:hypothetical protein
MIGAHVVHLKPWCWNDWVNRALPQTYNDDDDDDKVEVDTKRREILFRWTIKELVQRNGAMFQRVRHLFGKPPQIRLTRSFIDSVLFKTFPFLGAGTEKLVFDIGCGLILKRQLVSEGRRWEMDLNIMAQRTPGLFVDQLVLFDPKETDGSDVTWIVQKRLNPIEDSAKLRQEAYKRYGVYDDSWEWGLDERGIPHVYDWG